MDDHRFRQTAAALGLALLCAGCLPRNTSVDLLHARLRQNEEQLADLQAELQTSNSQLKQARREVDSLRTEMAESGRSNLTPEQASAVVQVTGIDVQPWLTGGVDKDDQPGDDALAVQFMPRDDQGEVVKLPGQVTITLSDPSAPTDQQTIGSWSFSPEECREAWTRGWLGGGYQFTLPWQHSPANSRLVVHVEYETPDGRSFDDTELVKVNPSPEALAQRTRANSHSEPKKTRPLADSPEGIRQAGRQQSSQKPFFDEDDFPDQPEEPEASDEPTDARPRMPHSVNWTEETIPRLR